LTRPRQLLADWIAKEPLRGRRRARTGPGRERSAEIRALARQRGHKASERGRIPATII
jgi:hypothetical protein